MIRPGIVLASTFALGIAGCARSKATPTSTEPAPSASPSSTPASAQPAPVGGRIKLCADGLHKPGDHWKQACNPCRCAADGEITCSNFPCPAPTAKADAGDAAP
jgi:hypothetical protein